jgi:hypothetical protein
MEHLLGWNVGVVPVENLLQDEEPDHPSKERERGKHIQPVLRLGDLRQQVQEGIAQQRSGGEGNQEAKATLERSGTQDERGGADERQQAHRGDGCQAGDPDSDHAPRFPDACAARSRPSSSRRQAGQSP